MFKLIFIDIYIGIAHQKFEQLHELNDSDYSISDKSDKSDESDNDSDSSDQSNVKKLSSELNNTNVSLRRSTRKKEVPFVSVYCYFFYYIF